MLRLQGDKLICISALVSHGTARFFSDGGWSIVWQVERCKYCVAEGETLLTKMRLFTPDMNWLRLWAFNGADDGTGFLNSPMLAYYAALSSHYIVWGLFCTRASNVVFHQSSVFCNDVAVLLSC